MTVRLHIDRLVVEGFDLTGAEAAHLRLAAEAELEARFAADEDKKWAGFAVRALAPLEIEAAPFDARELGRQAGAALHGAVTP